MPGSTGGQFVAFQQYRVADTGPGEMVESRDTDDPAAMMSAITVETVWSALSDILPARVLP